MASSNIKKSDNDTKIYEIKRKNILPYVGRVSVFILNSVENKALADEIEMGIKSYNIDIKRDVSEFDSYYNDIINIFDEVTYLVILVSKDFFLDWALMEILLHNYDMSGINNNIIPLIVENDLYEPIEKMKILKSLQEYSINFANKFFVEDYDEVVPEELAKMQQIIKMAKDFLNFSLNRDKKSNKPLYQKIVRYIESDMGANLKCNKKNITGKGDSNMNIHNEVTNHFHADVNGIQIQQGNQTAKQNQTFEQSEFDYENVQKVIEEIKRNENELEGVYGENVNKVQEILQEVALLAEKKKEPKKIRESLLLLKDLSIGISGSLIASGIASMISGLNL